MRIQRLSTTWEEWSHTKLHTIYECPLKFWYLSVEKKKAPLPAILAVGTALHSLAARRFAVRFRTPDSFCNTWKRFWLGVMRGEHGPDGYRRPAVPIAWSSTGEPWYWYHQGIRILRAFFERHAADDRTGMGAGREVAFRVPWRGFFLRGVIDRIDVLKDGVAIVDYKMGTYPPFIRDKQGTPQATIYPIGYERQVARRFDGRPLVSMSIENLLSGGIQPVALRGPEEEETLYLHVLAASNWVRALLTDWKPPAELRAPFSVFPVDQRGKPVLWPRLPRDHKGQCATCGFTEECCTFEREHSSANCIPDPRWLHRQFVIAQRPQGIPEQLELNIGRIRRRRRRLKPDSASP